VPGAERQQSAKRPLRHRQIRKRISVERGKKCARRVAQGASHDAAVSDTAIAFAALYTHAVWWQRMEPRQKSCHAIGHPKISIANASAHGRSGVDAFSTYRAMPL
jgi:hypothetical protein